MNFLDHDSLTVAFHSREIPTMGNLKKIKWIPVLVIWQQSNDSFLAVRSSLILIWRLLEFHSIAQCFS